MYKTQNWILRFLRKCWHILYSYYIYASIYVENAESNSAFLSRSWHILYYTLTIYMPALTYKMQNPSLCAESNTTQNCILLLPGRFIKILPHFDWELQLNEIALHYLFLLPPGRFIKILPHLNWELQLHEIAFHFLFPLPLSSL